MRPSEERYEVDQGAAPLEMLIALFEARGWPCESTQTEMSGEIQGSWTKSKNSGSFWFTMNSAVKFHRHNFKNYFWTKYKNNQKMKTQAV